MVDFICNPNLSNILQVHLVDVIESNNMGRSNYTLTQEQKVLLDRIAEKLEDKIEDYCWEHEILDVYDADGKFDNNKFTAIVWYVGEQLSYS